MFGQLSLSKPGASCTRFLSRFRTAFFSDKLKCSAFHGMAQIPKRRRLPPAAPDYAYVLVGGHIFLLNRRTNVVLDVFILKFARNFSSESERARNTSNEKEVGRRPGLSASPVWKSE